MDGSDGGMALEGTPPRGFEPLADSPQATHVQEVTDSTDARLPASLPKPAQDGEVYDHDLAAIVAAWPTLPEPIRAGILAMVRAAVPGVQPDVQPALPHTTAMPRKE